MDRRPEHVWRGCTESGGRSGGRRHRRRCEFHRRTDPDPGQRRAVRCRQRSDHEQCYRFRGPGGCAVSGHQAGHLSLPDLHGRGRHDRLRPPDRQPQEPAAGRCRSAGHFPDLSGLPPAGLHRRGVLLRGHHRRGRRPHGHLRHRHAGPGAAGPHRRVGLLLHGPGARHPAAHHEGPDH